MQPFKDNSVLKGKQISNQMKKHTTYLKLLIILLLTGTLVSCGKDRMYIRGNGEIGAETRDVPYFEGVVQEGSFEVIITPDTVSEVVVEAETNLIPFIETYVSGTALIVREKPNTTLRPHDPMRVFIKTPELKYAEVNGSGLLTTGYYVGNSLNLSISGSGRLESGGSFNQVSGYISGSGSIYLTGNTNIAEFNISGSGSIDAYGMQTDSCYVSIPGSGSAYVSVNDLLDVNISGSGSVYYKGTPAVFTTITGSGTVIQVP